MRKLIYIIIFIVVSSCSAQNKVYWCGDHPCINKKERETYFKKTMSVEIKKFSKDDENKNSEMEKIIQQAKLDEKKRITKENEDKKSRKSAEKEKIKEEKKLVKQMKLDEKKRKKEEKELTKQLELDEKERIKKEKALKKKIKLDKKEDNLKLSKSDNMINYNDAKTEDLISNKNTYTDFYKIVEKINKRNESRSFPDINDIPN